MSPCLGKKSILALALGLLASSLLAQPIANWSAPSTWTPPKTPGRITALDVTAPLPFIGLAPCRIADTRGNGFTGAYGPPSLSAGSPRNFTLGGQCGIPATAAVVS